jgi:hypothetical protein
MEFYSAIKTMGIINLSEVSQVQKAKVHIFSFSHMWNIDPIQIQAIQAIL